MLRKYEPDPSHMLDWNELHFEEDTSYEEQSKQIFEADGHILLGHTVIPLTHVTMPPRLSKRLKLVRNKRGLKPLNLDLKIWVSIIQRKGKRFPKSKFWLLKYKGMRISLYNYEMLAPIGAIATGQA